MSDTSGFQVDENAPRHYEDNVTPFMIPFSEALVRAVVKTGDAVLDVACGTGIAARIAFEATGPSGTVVGTDINAAMLGMAQSISAERQDEVSWDVASALDLPYDDDRFDAVICQQGVQFFPDPAAGLREMARVTKPGGQIGATVWSELSDSPYLTESAEVPVRFFGEDPRNLLFTSSPEKTTSWFSSAGLRDTSVEQVIVNVQLPPLAKYVPAHMKALPWGAGFFAASPDVRAQAIKYMEDKLAAYRTPTGIDVPFGSYLATATV
jgi:ubiquinone/menaquinone biosynthesis C-methylase UbiE